MPKYLVFSMGTGKGVEYGLKHLIKQGNPDEIHVLVSDESKDVLEQRLLPLIPEYKDAIKVHDAGNPEDIDECTDAAYNVILDIIKKGASAHDISADITSGTKAMTAGIAAAAFLLNVDTISYVSGTRDKDTGRVISNTERLLSVRPAKYKFIELSRELKRMFNLYRFSLGLEIIKEFRSTFSFPNKEDELENWNKLFRGYSYWDAFNHKDGFDCLKDVHGSFLQSLGIDISGNKEILGKIKTQTENSGKKVQAKGRAENTKEILKNKYSLEKLADLIANARRRKDESKFDDAVARLYRATEMIAQIELAKYGIDSARVSQEDIPNDARKCFPDLKDKESVSLGLQKSFVLLNEIEKAQGRENKASYYLNSNLKHHIKIRNESILAHGSTPVVEEDFNKFHDALVELISKFVGKRQMIDDLIQKATFPKIPEI